jgi:hypothetical protein
MSEDIISQIKYFRNSNQNFQTIKNEIGINMNHSKKRDVVNKIINLHGGKLK